MNIVIPINGKNERMGQLFKTPKHLLLYKGVPAIQRTISYLKLKFSDSNITILANRSYIDELEPYSKEVDLIKVGTTNSHVETLLQYTLLASGDIMFIDCDIIPMNINTPFCNTVYGFNNKSGSKQYSNYTVNGDSIIDCNEKDETSKYAGAGIYYFDDIEAFNISASGETSISRVIKKMILTGIYFKFDIDNTIFRFGTLNDIVS